MQLVSSQRRNRFQQRLRLLALKGRKIVTQVSINRREKYLEKYAPEEKSHWFKTTAQVTFGVNMSAFLGKRFISFFRNLVVIST